MTFPYENATAGNKALIELQKILAQFECQNFGTMTDMERGLTIVQFKWRNRTVSLEASWKGYAQAWLKAHPYSYRTRGNLRQHQQKALKQAQISVCSVLRDYVKAMLTTIEAGVMSFEAAFMSHMLLPNGQRVIDKLQADQLLPAPDDKIVEIKR